MPQGMIERRRAATRAKQRERVMEAKQALESDDVDLQDIAFGILAILHAVAPDT